MVNVRASTGFGTGFIVTWMMSGLPELATELSFTITIEGGLPACRGAATAGCQKLKSSPTLSISIAMKGFPAFLSGAGTLASLLFIIRVIEHGNYTRHNLLRSRSHEDKATTLYSKGNGDETPTEVVAVTA